MLRRPKPTRSGSPGWAPTATPASRASRTVSRITTGSPAWKPQATLAEVMLFISSASLPSVQRPKDSPRSEFRSIRIASAQSVRPMLSPLWLGTSHGAHRPVDQLQRGDAAIERHGPDVARAGHEGTQRPPAGRVGQGRQSWLGGLERGLDLERLQLAV